MAAIHLPERPIDEPSAPIVVMSDLDTMGADRDAPSGNADGTRLVVSLTRGMTWSLFAAVCVHWFIVRILGDVWWVATVAMYAPRWPLLVPVAFVAALSVFFCRRLLWINLLSATLILGPVMGLCLPSPFGGADQPLLQLRVLTANAGHASDERLREIVAAEQSDVVALQECSAKRANGVLGPGWHHSRLFGVSVFSRFPLSDSSAFPGKLVGRFGDIAVRVKMHTPAGPIWICNLHLNTPRWGFEELAVTRYGIQGAQAIADNTAQRNDESRRIRAWVDEVEGPKIVVGDLNMPVESAIFRRDWSSFTNAFSSAGLGYGHTKFTRWFGVRIDHILADRSFCVETCEVTGPTGGDHRPVVANISFKST